MSTKRFFKLFLYISAFVFFLLAFLSFDTNDPSFNRATNLPVKNLMGKPGSYITDLLLQFFDYGMWIIPITILSWTFTLFKNEEINHKFLRILFMFLSMVCASLLLKNGICFDLLFPILKNTKLDENIIFSFTLLLFVLSLYICLGIELTTWSNIFLKIRDWFKKFRSKIPDEIEIPNLKTNLKIFPKLKNHNEVAETSFFEKNSVFDEKNEPEIKPQQLDIERSIKSSKAATYSLDNNFYQLPSTDLLNKVTINKDNIQLNNSMIKKHKEELLQVLADFGVSGDISSAYAGPVVTLYELEPAAGTKSSRIIGLADDISRSMRALSSRIAVIPGRNAIGIELPNKQRETVYLRELLESKEYQDKNYELPIILGKDIAGNVIIADLAKMPHLLVAGTTGSGKSVAINTMILSLLYSLTPEECKFIMVDPKMLELSVYDGIPHLLTNVVTEPNKAIVALKWVVREMENRYRLMSNLAVRNIHSYNQRIKEAIKNNEQLNRTVQTGFNQETGKPIIEQVPIEMNTLPYIVVIVDEMADLMLVAGKEIETSIQRLAQMARAAGIHLIMATQRPSVDVITGVIKANFPTRISFQVTSKIDSRTILGEQGAEQLLGKGDMLYMAGGSKITRIHGPFVADNEVETVVSFLKSQGQPEYISGITTEDAGSSNFMPDQTSDEDDLYQQAIAIVQQEGKASTSFIQRCLKIGYNRAANIMDRMEKEGLVGKANHVGKREILF